MEYHLKTRDKRIFIVEWVATAVRP